MSRLFERRLSRRRLVGAIGTLGSVAAALPLLAACQSAPPTSAPAAPTAPAKAAAEAPKPTDAAKPTEAPKPTVAAAAPPTAAPSQSSAPAQPTAAQPAPAAASAARPTPKPDDWVKAAQPFKGKKVVILMSAGPWGKSHEQILPEFNSLTGMNVVYDMIPEPQISAKLQASVLARSGEYDGAVMIWDWMAQFRKAGLIADLTPYYNDPQYPAFDVDEFPEKIVNFLRREGKLYGIPVSVAAQIMHYRKDLFEEAGLKPPSQTTGLTWTEVYDYGKKLTKNNVVGTVHGWLGGGIYSESMNVLPGDKPILDQDKRLSIYRDPRMVEIYETWARMYKEGVMHKEVFSLNIYDAWLKFQSGGVAMQPLSWPISIAMMEDPDQSKIAGKVGYAPTPGATPRIGGWGCMVMSDSKNREAAYLHLAWLASGATTVAEVLKHGNYDSSYTKNIQGNLDKYKAEIVKARKFGASEVEGMVASWNGIKGGRMVDPDTPEFARLGNEMYPSLAKVVTGDVSAKDGLNAAADAGEKILAEAGYYKK
jgi:multiple sugar transport system substrate-binding protein